VAGFSDREQGGEGGEQAATAKRVDSPGDPADPMGSAGGRLGARHRLDRRGECWAIRLNGGKSVGGEFLDLVLQAGLVVKLVLLLLLAASILSWALIGYKWRALRGAEEDDSTFLDAYRHDPLDTVFEAARDLDRSPLAVIFLSGCEVMKRNPRPEGEGDSSESALAYRRKLTRAIQWAARGERQHAERGLTFLATVGSSAPFVGLFGTVVGIINTFQGIGVAGNASLAVVGPGMAEALIATAVGLLAAIPASVAYNVFIAGIEENNSAGELFAEELAEDLVTLRAQGAAQAES